VGWGGRGRADSPRAPAGLDLAGYGGNPETVRGVARDGARAYALRHPQTAEKAAHSETGQSQKNLVDRVHRVRYTSAVGVMIEEQELQSSRPSSV
jgi:hypothetical protein